MQSTNFFGELRFSNTIPQYLTIPYIEGGGLKRGGGGREGEGRGSVEGGERGRTGGEGGIRKVERPCDILRAALPA